MITRTDLQTSSSQNDFDSTVTLSYYDSEQEYPMDQSEFQYVDTTYPNSIYDLSQESEPDVRFEQTKSVVKNSVDGLLTIASPDSRSLSMDSSSPIDGIGYQDVMLKDLTSQHCRSPLSPDKLTCSLHDELDELCYSRPHTPSETLNLSNDFSDNLSHMDAYSDDSEPAKPTCLDRRNYDTSALMYGNDDMTFSGLVNCNDVLKTSTRKSQGEAQSDTIVCCYRSYSSDSADGKSEDSTEIKPKKEESFSSIEVHPEDNKKGKISGLQRHALDMIFSVTDRPSRGLVFHIAGELHLHHITVKNFFSNGRRRLRRAAARLNDPERTRRENQRRKEKRRLAALAAAASIPNGDRGSGSLRFGNGEGDPLAPREPPILSPERRALMEKLAVKVQRSVAQKGLAAANYGESISKCSSYLNTMSTNSNKTFTVVAKTHESQTKPSQLHSNFLTSVESLKGFETPSNEETYLHSNEEEFASIFSCAESDAVSSYNSSPDQNYSVYTPVEQENSPYVSVNQEDGPYSPTSWQTLLHS